MVYNLLTREITFGSIGDSELWFGFGQRQLRFSKYEFSLLIRLNFKRPTYIPRYSDKVVEGGVHSKYWPLLNVDVTTLQNWLYEIGLGFEHREDVLKMALVLFVERFSFDTNYKKKVSTWLFILAEDMEQFNSFSWEKFVF